MARKSRITLYYKPIPGSREIPTASPDSVSALKKLERSAMGEEAEIEYAGETLHKSRHPVSFPAELYDKVMPGLDALEQAVLGHIYRLSYGAGADWARVGKKELVSRTGLSHRRLLKTLSGLVEKGVIRPLHRDTNGTLYKVYTVPNMYSVGAEKQAPESHEKPDRQKKEIAPPRAKPLESPITEEAFDREGKVLTMRAIALEFFNKSGRKPSDVDMDLALAQITALLEDGFTRDEVRRAAAFLAENFGKDADISKLPYYIQQVIKNQA